jgi:tetratricopeptide (TPR) repeat protein
MIGRGSRGAPLVGFLLALLALAGCQSPILGPKAKQPSPSASAAPTNRLAAADRKLYAGDYDGAENDYRALVKEEVPGAASHYSTLLAYESRLPEAVAQAQAGVGARADSESLARLTRALDWSEDVVAAVATGRRAVATRPVVPLAHIFFSEALADAGRFEEARRELRTAETMVTDAYSRAELDREWANFYRGLSNPQSELNYLELAIKEQPGFPERQLELARYDYAKQKPAAAQAVLDRLLGGSNKNNYWALVGGGSAAFIGGDLDRASSLFVAAGSVRPGGAAAALGQAEIAVAAKRDFNSAHDVLLQALKKDPTSADVYRYLRYLDMLVLKKDQDAELNPIVPTPPSDLAAARKAAMDKVNTYRSEVGVPPLTEDSAVAEGAEAHAYYYLFNFGRPQVQGLSIHTEDPSLPGFSGESSIVRDRHFGYGGTRGGEVIDQIGTPEGSVQVWIDSVYHRFPLLARETSVAGYGRAELGITNLAILDLGIGDPGSGDAIVYPRPDQTDVPGAFHRGEVPDPVPPEGSYPVGYPVTLQVGAAQTLSVSSGRLIGPDGKDVPSYTLKPGSSGLTSSEWALLAKQPLAAGARYTVEVNSQVSGQDLSKRWSFTVASS